MKVEGGKKTKAAAYVCIYTTGEELEWRDELDTLILLLVGIAFLVIKWSWTNLVLLLVALIVLSVIRWLIKRQTIKYTRLEIAEIWCSEERQKEIINALQDK